MHVVLSRSVFKGFLFLRRLTHARLPSRPSFRARTFSTAFGAIRLKSMAVDVHIGRLRKALSHGRERDPIRTVRSAGYSFDEFFGKSWRQ